MYRKAFAGMYGDIFEVTVVICVVGALLGLLIGSRKEHAEEPEVPEERAASTQRPRPSASRRAAPG